MAAASQYGSHFVTSSHLRRATTETSSFHPIQQFTKSEGMFLESSGHHCLHPVLQITMIVCVSFFPQPTPDQSEYEQTPSDLVFTISDVNPEIGCMCLNMSKEGWQCKCCVYSRVLAKLT